MPGRRPRHRQPAPPEPAAMLEARPAWRRRRAPVPARYPRCQVQRRVPRALLRPAAAPVRDRPRRCRPRAAGRGRARALLPGGATRDCGLPQAVAVGKTTRSRPWWIDSPWTSRQVSRWRDPVACHSSSFVKFVEGRPCCTPSLPPALASACPCTAAARLCEWVRPLRHHGPLRLPVQDQRRRATCDWLAFEGVIGLCIAPQHGAGCRCRCCPECC